MRHAGISALVLVAGVLLGQPVIATAGGQPPAVTEISDAPKPSENLPTDFIDSRPIVAYFDEQPMPDTVRDLLLELKRSDRCGKDAKLQTEEACALVFYRLDDAFEPDPLRPPLIMRAIYRITEPENPAHTVMTMPDSKGELQRYVDGDLYEPLRNIRANICRQDKRMPDQCRATESQGVLYRPYGILGKIENDREGILPVSSASKHFGLNLLPKDHEWLKQQQMRDLCAMRTWDKKPAMIC